MTEAITEIQFLRERIAERDKRIESMIQAYGRIVGVVSTQEEEPTLWFKDAVLLRSSPSQNALKALHIAVVDEHHAFWADKKPPTNPPPGETL